MALWIVRGGSHGEHEGKFIDESKVFLTWGELTSSDLTKVREIEEIRSRLSQIFPSESAAKLTNHSGQIRQFLSGMKKGDWIVLPRKNKPTIAIGEVLADCEFDPSVSNDYRHFRKVKWLNTEIPRSNFEQDILYSFGAFLTICEIKRNDAEARVRAMARNDWKVSGASGGKVKSRSVAIQATAPPEPIVDDAGVDFEALARDEIARLIIRKFKGHGMARLCDAILRAQGFTTFLSPEGADKGIDILAGSGPFGFDSPRICVQVKSGDTPADHPEFTHLIGAVDSVQAEYGLFVSWSDFKSSVNREEAAKFFKVRLWNQNDVIDQLLKHYDRLDQDIRAEIPLKQIWLVANQVD